MENDNTKTLIGAFIGLMLLGLVVVVLAKGLKLA